jgi:hypothetical protein
MMKLKKLGLETERCPTFGGGLLMTSPKHIGKLTVAYVTLVIINVYRV